jgi:hypothetical protein
MLPSNIATIRERVKALEAQAARLRAEQPRVAEELRSCAGQLYQAISPYCWACGGLLSAVDPADHLCAGCIGGLPLDFPD